MRSHPAQGAVLLLVDLQQAIDDPSWGSRNNPQADANIVKLLELWRASGWPVWHVRHDSLEAASPYRPGQPGNAFRPDSAPRPGEKVIAKQTNSAFIGTSLEADLRAAGDGRVAVVGVITNNSVEATVRMAGNLGFETYLVEDACFTFGRADYRGVLRTADEIHAMSLANLDGEYCRVVTADEVLGGG
jgi:nicotinamidase-related amidase